MITANDESDMADVETAITFVMQDAIALQSWGRAVEPEKLLQLLEDWDVLRERVSTLPSGARPDATRERFAGADALLQDALIGASATANPARVTARPQTRASPPQARSRQTLSAAPVKSLRVVPRPVSTSMDASTVPLSGSAPRESFAIISDIVSRRLTQSRLELPAHRARRDSTLADLQSIMSHRRETVSDNETLLMFSEIEAHETENAGADVLFALECILDGKGKWRLGKSERI